ncbi:DUF692 domain-containing protein [Streptomyces sp. CC208A]|uniref:DUF692 domain-containing protein n=1 Tax=Streptomyces sp. CC208A TaxID=3044573 RepID=UPI0024A8534A|nr:DUF692 domain-containing protein [Streptomyces sp. CC208A]
MTELGIGIGWRPEIADAVEELPGVDWVEVVAENVCADHLPDSLARLRARGVTVVPHGVSLGLGGAERPDPERLAALAAKAEALGAPLVTEHLAFVRAGGPLTATPRLEAGHLLPVPRTRDALDVLCENVRIAQEALPVPLALENIAALFSWPGEELTEGRFLAELVERTGVRLLVDVANLYTNHRNRGEDPARALAELPLEALAYVHVAGGIERDGVWHDSHAHPVPEPVLEILADLAGRIDPPGVLLERDDRFPAATELAAELTAIRTTVAAARPARTPVRPTRRHGLGAAALRAGRALTGDAPPLIGAGARVSGGPMPAVRPNPVPAPAAVKDVRPSGGGERGTLPEGVRQRAGLAQAALLSALVAGTPAPEGFDVRRLKVQSRALAAKRASVVARIAPELPEILGEDFRPAFLAYARTRPMPGSYRRDALDFVEGLLLAGRPERRELTRWWQDRSDSRPPGIAGRVVRAARHVFLGR